MEKELKRRLIAVLEEGDKRYISASAERKIIGNDKNAQCFHDLEAGGYIIFSVGFGYFTSLAGQEYLERLRAPRKAWLKKHYLGFIAGVVTAGLAAVIGTLVNNLIS